ncbi:basic secretory protein-like protein [Sphingobacterium hungaricum]|uniref:F5/8 type C domain-containing protein n=1 Tax=Sphingobacterium hungaricum TaxID=2082723 RepID=A0A928UY64_9SPHI|nr:basic secretory protein-like protein [Sphingobacterium hungaricum]MBE8713601.1 hypothetical protein [Sphingobacterium hungaricum]
MRILLAPIANALVVLFLVFSTSSCVKNEKPIIPEEEIEEPENAAKDPISVNDVTSKGILTVSQENPSGAQGNEGSSKLIDNNKDTKFLIFDFKPDFYIQLELDSARLIGAYEFTTGNDADGRDPMDWTITGSNDGTNWEVVDRQIGEQLRSRKLTKRFDFKNSKKFKYYRWNITSVYYGDVFQASEFRLLEVPREQQELKPITYVDSISKDGLTLHFINKTGSQQLAYQEKMIETFFTNYPKLLNDFNPNAQKSLYFIVDPTYDGVAYAIGKVVVYSYNYMQSNPKDIDVVTHEIMHHIQAYSGGAPGWLSEGIADYVRYAYGLDNAGAGWSLPNFQSNQSYTDAYRVTARFLAWIEKHVKPGFVKDVDQAIRNKTYTEAFWQANTGKNVDDLWAKYASNPAL